MSKQLWFCRRDTQIQIVTTFLVLAFLAFNNLLSPHYVAGLFIGVMLSVVYTIGNDGGIK